MAFKLAKLSCWAIVLLGYCLTASFVFAQNGGDDSDVARFSDLEILIKKILGGAVSLGLVVLFVMLLWGGFKYMTAGGNPEANQAAQKIITYAILGLVLMIGAWFILRFLEIFTGVPLTEFSLILPT